jgi:hypothetical protein
MEISTCCPMPCRFDVKSCAMQATSEAAPDSNSAAVPAIFTGSRSFSPIEYISPAKAYITRSVAL